MRIDIITIFPEFFEALDISLIGKAKQRGLIDVHIHDLRAYTYDRHRTVDDTPYGGGAGMVMKPEPWGEALTHVLNDAGVEADNPPLLLVPSPAGQVFGQPTAHAWAEEPHIVFACGRYEGIDERVIEWARERFRVVPFSLGDYVLNGGEVASMAVIEAVVRLVPGMVGNPESLIEESHSVAGDALLEYPVYTKPAVWEGREAPAVLLSGDHAKVARARRDWQLERTSERRPDLIEKLTTDALDKQDKATLTSLGWNLEGNHPARSGN
ncbi:tRNA (guanosine(37)-N1)-methyltransferase TrmD [Pseudoglutamicibacter cumminsii]|uniref:tRNA (guanine-N(1)-)-methyltransferase n=1 Tax=Pseudoglutamicibacter cumminsii TaxID=156979 RepID=A0ABX5L3V8_9MICC|nr:tRNA (guanosine(37)-N1)-methyltransferase TrmD [Pseudoglutamicibacter cumminsii]MDZ3745602.1 tRNA (guanosine(37)-N1)-methyltransferase TrmD [Pseudoglutamicibacter cumminsii]PWI27307.1 tRNA (guanosine(37)-N1)-methyltransferase TrmD [Pseudoglutamicibacter cumminsii]